MTDENEETPERSARSRQRAAQTDASEPAAKTRSSKKKALPAHATPAEAEPEADDAAEVAAMARADVMIDQAGQRVGHFLSTFSHQLRVAAARVQEEGEDIWAEAQHLRHKEHA